MKASAIKRQAYEQTYGPVSRGRRASSEETLALYRRVEKLAIDEYLLVEPEPSEKLKAVRVRLYQALTRIVKQVKAPFVVRVSRNDHEKHVVIYKEPIRKAAAA